MPASEAEQPQLGTLTVVRQPGQRDLLRDYGVWLDGSECGQVAQGSVTSFRLLPGRHKVQLKLDWAKSKPLGVIVEEDANVTVYCRAGGRGALAPVLRRNDYIDLGLDQWPEESSTPAKQWGVRGLWALGGGLLLGVLVLVVLGLAGVSSQIIGATVAAIMVLWICISMLAERPIAWKKGRKEKEL